MFHTVHINLLKEEVPHFVLLTVLFVFLDFFCCSNAANFTAVGIKYSNLDP